MDCRLFLQPNVVEGVTLLSFTWPQLQNPCRSYHFRPKLLVKCAALTKQSHRFLSTLATTAAAGDHSATNRLIRKFVASSPKSVALNVLSLVLAPDTSQLGLSSVAMTLYSTITEATWFTWNSRLVADLVAFLDKHGQYSDSEALISETFSKLGGREREVVNFYCRLIESQSKHGSNRGFDNSYAYLRELLRNSSSVYVKRRAFESIISGLCSMDKPQEAATLVRDMRVKGITPSAFEYRSVVYAYGTLGLFEDMERVVEQMENDGIALDTVCFNMILSSYGVHKKLADMVPWLRRMKNSCVPFSVRTYNSVLNSCPKIMSILQDKSTNLPLSIADLTRALDGDEVLLVEELAGTSLLKEIMAWDATELKLDLHGAHNGAAYLIVLQWLKEVRLNFEDGNSVIPAEVTVICGSGNHSSVRGESPLKSLVKDLMVRMGSPLRIDRKNIGCFVAKGKVVRNWLCSR